VQLVLGHPQNHHQQKLSRSREDTIHSAERCQSHDTGRLPPPNGRTHHQNQVQNYLSSTWKGSDDEAIEPVKNQRH